MNNHDMNMPGGIEAELVYGDGDFNVVRRGDYVVCAVTGVRIPIERLRYWSVERQEAYATPEASMKRYLETHARPKP